MKGKHNYRYRVNEDVTTNDVRSIVNDKIDSFVDSNEFEKRVKEITADVIENYFKMMYTKRGFWKSDIKR